MQVSNINLNNLRVFASVYRTKCMTTASKELHLTQSGVSQHIKSLEQTLNVKLFDRIHKRIMPTEHGDALYKQCRPALDQLSLAVFEVSQAQMALAGDINIGMPVEFGTNIVIPVLAEIGKEHPELCFNLTLDFASTMNDLLIRGELDIAFVDDFKLDGRIAEEKVVEEIFEMVATKNYLKRFGAVKSSHKAYFERFDYVAYEENEPVLRSWFAHHYRRKNLNLNVRARVMDVQGIAMFVLNDMGVGILPDHLVAKLIKAGHQLVVFPGSGRPFKNTISMAYLKNRSRGALVDMVIEELKKKLVISPRPKSTT